VLTKVIILIYNDDSSRRRFSHVLFKTSRLTVILATSNYSLLGVTIDLENDQAKSPSSLVLCLQLPPTSVTGSTCYSDTRFSDNGVMSIRVEVRAGAGIGFGVRGLVRVGLVYELG